ncbi:dihydroflavonol-4-reductase [Aureimonas endophytica]|uniref:Dihydroflavonol-4-reductase n=1 Tax=Aureimonas endophytica TaxID=2027858 RepID=A0A916ZEA3_9HYPH|nr:aldehyde reductase [Aureimonas endophytica]GGD89723.1 dihydroflavonol-4-reductase [Aureimonas endophytica]
MAEGDLVLLTGISGFIAKHVCVALLQAGYRVRGTVRYSSKREHTLRAFRALGLDQRRFEIVKADLTQDDGWDEAAAGCRCVLHVASPFPRRAPGDKLALADIAKGGTLRVLRAAERAGAERVVLTSSVAAIYYGHENRPDQIFTEADFSNVQSRSISAYALSKTLAETAAWDFSAKAGFDLVTINPSLVLGPLLDDEHGTSVHFVRMMMQGLLPVVPRITLGIVDVRDVAQAHVRALQRLEAAGRRFITSAGPLSFREMAAAIGRAVPQARWRLPKATLPDPVVRLAARVSSEAAQALPELGRIKHLDAGPATNILGVTFLPPEETVAATALSLAEHGLVPARLH